MCASVCRTTEGLRAWVTAVVTIPAARVSPVLVQSMPEYPRKGTLQSCWNDAVPGCAAAVRAVVHPIRSFKMSVVQEEPSPEIPSHPEEIKSVFDLRVGKHITLQGSARITPAGVISTGLAVAAMTLALGYLVSSIRRRRY